MWRRGGQRWRAQRHRQARRRGCPRAFRTHLCRMRAVQPGVRERGQRAVSAALMLDAGLLLLLFTMILSVSLSPTSSLSRVCLLAGCCGELRRIKDRNSHAGAPPPPEPVPARAPSAVREPEAALGLICLQHFPSLTRCPLVFRGPCPRRRGGGHVECRGGGEDKGLDFVSFQRTHSAGSQRQAIAKD